MDGFAAKTRLLGPVIGQIGAAVGVIRPAKGNNASRMRPASKRSFAFLNPELRRL